MSIKSYILLALSVTALAHPKRHHHHFPHGTGTGSDPIMPTNGPFPLNNGTNSTGNGAFGAGSPSGTGAALTMTFSPAPASSPSSTASFNSPVEAIGGSDPAESSPVEAAALPTGCSSSMTLTTTLTSINYATVTVASDESASTTVPSGDTVDQPSVSAAAFFGRPSNGGSSSFGGQGPSNAASMSFAPTSFMTFATPAASGNSGFSSTMSIPAQSSTVPSGSDSSGKKGLSYNDASLTDAFVGDGITWAYNWAASPGGTILSGAEYVPLLWGENSISGWASAAQSAISAGSSHVLSFNEPDLDTQSNLTPENAAQLHQENMGGFGDGVQVGSPAVTNGDSTDPPMGTNWLSEFFQACNGNCKVDFIAFHYYSDTNLENFQNYVSQMIQFAQQNGISEVWLTEFGATGSDDDVASFISQATSWLDQQSAVGRYAYFMCGDGTLLSGTSLSTLGQAYAA